MTKRNNFFYPINFFLSFYRWYTLGRLSSSQHMEETKKIQLQNYFSWQKTYSQGIHGPNSQATSEPGWKQRFPHWVQVQSQSQIIEEILWTTIFDIHPYNYGWDTSGVFYSIFNKNWKIYTLLKPRVHYTISTDVFKFIRSTNWLWYDCYNFLIDVSKKIVLNQNFE